MLFISGVAAILYAFFYREPVENVISKQKAEIIDKINEAIANFSFFLQNKPYSFGKLKEEIIIMLKKIRFFVFNMPDNDNYKVITKYMENIHSKMKIENDICKLVDINFIYNETTMLLPFVVSVFKNFSDKKYNFDDLITGGANGHGIVSDDEECKICLDILKNFPICIAGCGHIFHKKCFISVIEIGNNAKENCPYCRDLYYDGKPKIPKKQY